MTWVKDSLLPHGDAVLGGRNLVPFGGHMFLGAEQRLKSEIHLLDGSWRTFCKLDREQADHVTREVGIANCRMCLANYKRSAS